MNREYLAWALKATLPHAGRVANFLDVVTVSDGRLWATDRYTVGIAPGVDIPDCRLRRSDAVELSRFVRPGKVAERAERVAVRVTADELHVGILDDRGGLADSAIFPLVGAPDAATVSSLSYVDVAALLARMSEAAPDDRPGCYIPDTLARFAAASDLAVNAGPVRFYLRRMDDVHLGAALVTVGQHFYGAIGGVDPSAHAAAPWPFPSEAKAA